MLVQTQSAEDGGKRVAVSIWQAGRSVTGKPQLAPT